MRPLLIATAGHVQHGKSTFIKYLTKTDPDRLPDEKRRGITLDLGFVNTADISFIDCPGHEGLVKHMIAGQRAVDGACLIVDLNEGVREQTREHARILAWLKVEKILLVLSKADLVAEEFALEKQRLILSEIQNYFAPEVQIRPLLFSAKSKDQNLFGHTLISIKDFFLKDWGQPYWG